MRIKTLAAATAGAAMLAMWAPQTTIADTLTVTSWGGSYSMSQRKALHEPFMRETGHVVLEDEWDGSLSLIRAMVETGNYKTHLVDAVPSYVETLCDEGMLEPIDYEGLGLTHDDFLPGAAHECGLGSISWSTVFAYRTDVFPDDPPKNWVDFWNVEKYPGKRGLYKPDPAGTMEFALMADGVPAKDVYKVLREEGGCRPRLCQDGRAQRPRDMVGDGRASTAAPGGQRSGDDHGLERTVLQCGCGRWPAF